MFCLVPFLKTADIFAAKNTVSSIVTWRHCIEIPVCPKGHKSALLCHRNTQYSRMFLAKSASKTNSIYNLIQSEIVAIWWVGSAIYLRAWTISSRLFSNKQRSPAQRKFGEGIVLKRDRLQSVPLPSVVLNVIASERIPRDVSAALMEEPLLSWAPQILSEQKIKKLRKR